MLYDITPVVSSRLAVWPGDTPARREVLLDQARGDSVTLSTLHATVHLGAHADAPNHYGVGGASIEDADLQRYLGPCQVIRIPTARGGRVASLPVAVTEPRVLIATDSYPDPERFAEDFAALDSGLIDALHAAGVQLVGIDTPSVDLFASKDLPTHAACFRHDVRILEGLMLEGVPEGVYELIALPLRLEGFDASPVRAVLRVP